MRRFRLDSEVIVTTGRMQSETAPRACPHIYVSVHLPYNGDMTATKDLTSKDSRFEMRLTGEQRSKLDEAAETKGLSTSQWALSNLLEAAERDIREARVMRLDDKSWDAFVTALDEPMPSALVNLLEREPIWR